MTRKDFIYIVSIIIYSIFHGLVYYFFSFELMVFMALMVLLTRVWILSLPDNKDKKLKIKATVKDGERLPIGIELQEKLILDIIKEYIKDTDKFKDAVVEVKVDPDTWRQ